MFIYRYIQTKLAVVILHSMVVYGKVIFYCLGLYFYFQRVSDNLACYTYISLNIYITIM